MATHSFGVITIIICSYYCKKSFIKPLYPGLCMLPCLSLQHICLSVCACVCHILPYNRSLQIQNSVLCSLVVYFIYERSWILMPANNFTFIHIYCPQYFYFISLFFSFGIFKCICLYPACISSLLCIDLPNTK